MKKIFFTIMVLLSIALVSCDLPQGAILTVVNGSLGSSAISVTVDGKTKDVLTSEDWEITWTAFGEGKTVTISAPNNDTREISLSNGETRTVTVY